MKPSDTLRALFLVCLVLTRPAAFAHSATEPVPRGEASWQERHKLLNQRAAEAGDKAQVIFIGDSITQGWEGEGKEVWARYYAHRNGVNLGIGGDRTQHVLWRLTHGNLEGLKPQAAVVMIGTNNSNGEDNTVEQIADGVAAIIQSLRTQLPETTILLVAIFPRSENPTAQRGKILMVNQVIHKLADGDRVRWIDFGHQFLDGRGLLPRELMPDYLHLSSRGYALWAEALEDTLSQVLGDARVSPAPSPTAALAGEWIWTINGPDGQPVSAPLIIDVHGERVTAKFARGPDRWLVSENGKVTGNEFSWRVTRDRSGGGSMVYEMSGKVEGNTITGTTRTTMDGNEVTAEWKARRP